MIEPHKTQNKSLPTEGSPQRENGIENRALNRALYRVVYRALRRTLDEHSRSFSGGLCKLMAAFGSVAPATAEARQWGLDLQWGSGSWLIAYELHPRRFIGLAKIGTFQECGAPNRPRRWY